MNFAYTKNAPLHWGVLSRSETPPSVHVLSWSTGALKSRHASQRLDFLSGLRALLYRAPNNVRPTADRRLKAVYFSQPRLACFFLLFTVVTATQLAPCKFTVLSTLSLSSLVPSLRVLLALRFQMFSFVAPGDALMSHPLRAVK